MGLWVWVAVVHVCVRWSWFGAWGLGFGVPTYPPTGLVHCLVYCLAAHYASRSPNRPFCFLHLRTAPPLYRAPALAPASTFHPLHSFSLCSFVKPRLPSPGNHREARVLARGASTITSTPTTTTLHRSSAQVSTLDLGLSAGSSSSLSLRLSLAFDGAKMPVVAAAKGMCVCVCVHLCVRLVGRCVICSYCLLLLLLLLA